MTLASIECSYADIVMGEIDKRANIHDTNKPNLWWLYRDDIIDFWTLCLDKQMRFPAF